MGVLIGYMANRNDALLRCLRREKHAITPDPTDEPTGWGVGFYQDGEVLHKKRRRLEASDVNFSQIVEGVRSDCAIIHLRQATVGDFRTENTHPFRLRSWLFAHSGTIHRFEAMRDSFLEAMPDFIRRSIRGETDSEHFFHLIAAFLHDAGQLDRGGGAEDAVLHALRSSVRLVERLAREVDAIPPVLNVLLTDGQTLYAVCKGGPMHWVERQLDLVDSEDAPARSSVLPGPRYVLVEGARNVSLPDYDAVSDGTVVIVSRDPSVRFAEL